MVKMRDGALLATDIYLREEGSVTSAVLVRTPYSKDFITFNIEPIIDEGYALVIQDCRGRFSSEGTYEPLLVDARRSVDGVETNDAADTVEWLNSQAWCSGKVGMFGISAYAAPVWGAAVSDAPIATGIPLSTGSMFGGFGFYTTGVPQLDVLLVWSAGMCSPPTTDNELARLFAATEAQAESLFELFAQSELTSPESRQVQQRANTLLTAYREAAAKLFALPLHEAADQVMQIAPWVKRWLEHADATSSYWQDGDWHRHLDQVKTPLLHVVGWHDMFVRSALASFAELSAKKDGPFQKIVINPASHYSYSSRSPDFPVGEVKFSREDFFVEPWFNSETPPKYEGQLFNRWMRHWLEGEDTGLLDDAPISLFVMGENLWRDEWEWPLARTEWTPLYLHSDGDANSIRGNGSLSFDAPTESKSFDTYIYDPADPVPSRGGTFLGVVQEAGMVDQYDVESRDDVLVFTTQLLEEDLEVTGPLTAMFWVNSSAIDTDFTVRITDVHPDGKSYGVCDGVSRLRYLGLANPKPGTPFELAIELSPTSYLFKKGHLIRLQVSSSNYPLIDINPNTGRSLLLDEANEMIEANQMLYHDQDRPSHLVLPVIPRQPD